MKRNPYFLVAFLLVAIIGASLGPRLSLAQTPGSGETEADMAVRTVTVLGTGRVEAHPDYATIRVGVQTEADTASAALAANNEQMQSLIDTLKGAGIAAEDIQTQTVQLQPRYEQPGPQTTSLQLTGYTAANIVQVRVQNLDNLGQILDAAVQAGGNTIEGINFDLSNPTEVTDQARQEAMQEARRKAEQLASLGGAELGEIMSINETGGALPPPRPMAAETFAAQAAAVPIEPGTQTVEVNIQATWLLR